MAGPLKGKNEKCLYAELCVCVITGICVCVYLCWMSVTFNDSRWSFRPIEITGLKFSNWTKLSWGSRCINRFCNIDHRKQMNCNLNKNIPLDFLTEFRRMENSFRLDLKQLVKLSELFANCYIYRDDQMARLSIQAHFNFVFDSIAFKSIFDLVWMQCIQELLKRREQLYIQLLLTLKGQWK